jgi:hypothetical protein
MVVVVPLATTRNQAGSNSSDRRMITRTHTLYQRRA